MKNASETPSPSSRTRSKKLNPLKSEMQSPDSVLLNSKTPEKTLHRRSRNRGVALSVAEVRKVAKGLQDRKQGNDGAASSEAKAVRRQIVLPSPSKPKDADDDAFKLPEKYEILGEFFHSMDSSIRLLRLKGSSSTFTNISPKVECLTDRRFTHSHLAQLKFLLPEVIVIEKLLVFNERTSCMEPELHVTIDREAVESDAKLAPHGGSVLLRKLLRKRLRDFLKSHPEGDDIPMETLPEPFNHPKKGLLDQNENITVSVSTSVELPSAKACHVPSSFKRRFFQKSENGADSIIQRDAVEGSKYQSSTAHPPTPIQTKDGSHKNIDAGSTPAKLVSTPSGMMASTPALPPPKRQNMSPDDSNGSLNKLVRRPSRFRSLKFDSPIKGKKETVNGDDAGDSRIDDDILDVLSPNLIESIREKERVATEERDPAISQAKRRKKIIASLPKLFNMISLLYSKRSVIPKKEFVNKIISSHCDIVDKSEVEEQLNLLLELVPEWISEQVSSSGDCLCCINKTLNPETVRTTLEEAQ